MPKLVTNHALTIQRDGANVYLKSGEAFDFTREEIADLAERAPTALRKGINETAVMPALPEGPEVRGNTDAGGEGEGEGGTRAKPTPDTTGRAGRGRAGKDADETGGL